MMLEKASHSSGRSIAYSFVPCRGETNGVVLSPGTTTQAEGPHDWKLGSVLGEWSVGLHMYGMQS